MLSVKYIMLEDFPYNGNRLKYQTETNPTNKRVRMYTNEIIRRQRFSAVPYKNLCSLYILVYVYRLYRIYAFV